MIRLAVAGCGGHGLESHIIPGEKIGFEVVAVFDPSAENTEALRQRIGYDPMMFTDFGSMVHDRDVDAVLITSPDMFHATQLFETVQAGKPVLCDKPLAATKSDLDVLRKAMRLAVRQGVPVMSCHPRRESAELPYGWAKAQLIGLRKLYGALMHVELDFSYHRPTAPWKMARSLLLDHFTHELDYLLWLLGDVQFSVQRIFDTSDRYSVAGRIGEVSLQFHGSRRLDAKTYPETIRLRFERGTVDINAKTGAASTREHETEQVRRLSIQPIDYDLRFHLIMTEFKQMIKAPRVDEARLQQLFKITEAAVTLSVGSGHYTSAP